MYAMRVVVFILLAAISHALRTSLRHKVLQHVTESSKDDRPNAMSGDPYRRLVMKKDPQEEDLKKLQESLDAIEDMIGKGNKELMDELTKTRTCLSDKTQCSADVMGALSNTIPSLADAIKSGDKFEIVMHAGETVAALVSAVPGGQVWGAGIGLAFTLVSSIFGSGSSSGPPPLTGDDVRSIVEKVVQAQSDQDYLRDSAVLFNQARENILRGLTQWEDELDSANGDKEKLNAISRDILDGKLSGKVDAMGDDLFKCSIKLREIAVASQNSLDDLLEDKKTNIDKLMPFMCTKAYNSDVVTPCLAGVASIAQQSYTCSHFPCRYDDQIEWHWPEKEFWLPKLVEKKGFKGFCVKNERKRDTGNIANCVLNFGFCSTWKDNLKGVKECEEKVDRAKTCQEMFEDGPSSSSAHWIFHKAMLDFKGIVLRYMMTFSRMATSLYSEEYREKLRRLSNTKPLIARWSQWSPIQACGNGAKLYRLSYFPQSNGDGYVEYCEKKKNEWGALSPYICWTESVEEPDLYDYNFIDFLAAVPKDEERCKGCLSAVMS